MSVNVLLFGAPRILRDGEALRFDTRKATALLAYLSVTGKPHRREFLAGLLWPEAPASRARATLRRTLSVAAAVGPVLHASGSDVWLAEHVSDVREFEGLAKSDDEADLRRAATLADQPFLAGFALRDSPEFDEWQAATADRLRDLQSAVLARLVRAAGTRGAHAAALDYARRRVALDALSEPANRDLMVALALSGEPAAALRDYRALVRLLDRELSVAPLPETAALAEQIRSGEAPSWPTHHPAVALPAPTAPPLVGREAVLADLRAVGVFGVTGESGIGRTAILSALAGSVSGTVMFTTCRASDVDLPFGAAADLLAPLLNAPAADDALAGLIPTATPISVGAQRRRLDAVLSLISQAPRPLLLLIDDAHLADPASAGLLAQVASRLPADVTLVASWTTAGARLPLPQAIADAGTVRRLPGLDIEAVRSLTGAERAQTALERTRGVPRFLLEWLAAEDADASLVGLVSDRLDRVSPCAQQLLSAAAVLDAAAGPELLRGVAGRAEVEAVEGLEECVARGLLVETVSGYELPHDTARDLIRDRIGLARRHLLHRRAAEALAVHHDVAPATVARHYREAGDIEQAQLWSRRAARDAILVRADVEALQHLQQAGTDADVLREIGDVRVRLGQYDQAIASYESGLALGSDRAALHHRLALVLDRLGELDTAEEHLDAALATLAGGDSFAAVVRADRALLRYRRGDYEGAEFLARAALDVAPARAHNVLGLVALGRGLLDASLAEFELARVSAWGEQLTDVWVAAGQNASRALQALGRLDDALSMAEMTLREAQRDSDLQRVAAVTSQVADVLHALGRGDEARELQREATQLFVQVALPSQRPAVWLAADW